MAYNIDWDNLSNIEAKSCFDEDLGKVLEVYKDHILTERGIISQEKFLIPKDLVESFNGKVLRFKISEKEIQKYKHDDINVTINDQYNSTLNINKGGGSYGGIQIEDKSTHKSEQINKKDIRLQTRREQITIEKKPRKINDDDYKDYLENTPSPVSKITRITIPIKKEEYFVSNGSSIKNPDRENTF